MSPTGPNQASLGRSLFHMTWPMIFGVLAQMTFQLVDSIFISRLGVEPLAALGFTVPVYQLAIGLQVGVGIATTALISRAVGAGDALRARRLGGLVVVAGGALMLLFCLLSWLFRRPLLGALGPEASLMPVIDSYWLPWLASAWAGAMAYFAYSVSRAHGDTRFPGLMMVVTSLINLILDPLFIFGFGWGLPGAALATIAAFGFGAVLAYQHLTRRRWLALDLQALPAIPALRQLAGISGPAMVGQLMPALAAMLATSLIARFGAAAVGAWALATRLEFFSIVVVLGLTMSLPPMIGRLLGLGDLKQARTLVRMAVRFVLLLQLAVAAVWFALSGVLPTLLTPDREVASILGTYMWLVPVSYGALGVCMLMVSVCNALALPMRALFISLVRLFICYLPALWLGAQVAGLYGIFAGALVGNLGAGAGSYLLYRRGMARVAAAHCAHAH